MRMIRTLLPLVLTLVAVVAIQTSPATEGQDRVENSEPDASNETTDSTALIITGILVDDKGKPLANKEVSLFLANRETTVKTTPDSLRKPGLGARIEGAGTLRMAIVGIEGGGAYKLIEGGIVNPSSKTDGDGKFRFEVSDELIAGEEGLIITTKRPRNPTGGGFIDHVSLIDEEGVPIILKIDEIVGTLDLGEVEIFKD